MKKKLKDVNNHNNNESEIHLGIFLKNESEEEHEMNRFNKLNISCFSFYSENLIS